MKDLYKILLGCLSIFLVVLVSSGLTWAQSQIITPTPSATVLTPGAEFTLNINYDTSNGNTELSGLGLAVHYNSSVLEWIGFNDLYPEGLIGQSSVPQDDIKDTDNNAATDKVVLIGWADVEGCWPGKALPLDLAALTFRVVPDIKAPLDTVINITPSSVATGYRFEASPVELSIK